MALVLNKEGNKNPDENFHRGKGNLKKGFSV